jgi:leader peptidase (prepilin peptidase) / N-methyltransferase
MLGAVFGSFIGTLTQRWGQGRSIAGRSHCETCQRQLSFIDLIPVISFTALKGRCRTCSAPIGRRQVLIELTAAGIGAAALFISPDAVGLGGALFGWALFTLFLFDVEHFWLPNTLTLPLAALGLVLGFGQLEDRIIGLAAGFLSLTAVRLIYLLVRKREGMGGGDPKLFGAIGAWLGWINLPVILVGASVIGLATIAIRAVMGKPVSGDVALPFGALMAVAGFAGWMLRAENISLPF